MEPIVLAQAESNALVNGIIRIDFHERQYFFSLLTLTALQMDRFYSVYFAFSICRKFLQVHRHQLRCDVTISVLGLASQYG